MFVDTDNIGHFLAERGLLKFSSVVDGDFMVVDQTSRNQNLKVVRQKSPGFFIKQIRTRTPEYMESMQREAACYHLAKKHPEFRSLNPLLPEFHYFDPVNYILVLELLSDAESLWEYHRRVRRFPLEVARLQGAALGVYHNQTHLNGQLQGNEVFKRQIPWILSIHETNPLHFAQLSRGNTQLVQIVQQYPEFQTALMAIKASWSYSVLTHGDIKWENMMICRQNTDAPELKIIDWEIADVGDECWDAGGVLQAYLSFWIFSLPLGGETPLEQAALASPFDTDGIKPALAAYWSSYAANRSWNAETSRQMLQRCMSCAAARMIQTAYESIQMSPQISPQALCKLQMSMNILRDPATAVTDLIGL